MAEALDEDERLMMRAGEGDVRAFQTLVERHSNPAFRLALRTVGARAEAEDVVQEAFIRLWAKAPDWRPGKARLSTWLWRVVMNLCLDAKRRPKPLPWDETFDPPDPAPNALAELEAVENQGRLDRAIADLPQRQREAIALVYGAGASNAQAAETLGISVGALEQLLIRAKRALRGAMGTEVDS